MATPNLDVDAVTFRARIIRELATVRPTLCDGSGIGFWPIPVMIPVVLANCLYRIHVEWLERIKVGDYGVAAMLSEVRTRLTRLVAEGDLGEDHAGIFIREHPAVMKIDIDTAPFFQAYSKILEETDPFVLLGFVYSIEAGSLEAIKALVELRMITNGEFARLHMMEEVEHGIIAAEMRDLVLSSEYAARFTQGCSLHNHLYEETVARQAS